MALVTLRIFRMAIIVFKEFTQPVKKLFVNIAHHNNFFRKYICKPPAQGYHCCENALLMLLAKDNCKNYGPLTEEESINLGSAIWAEVVVFICCSKIVILESNRQSKKKDEGGLKVLKNQDEDVTESLKILQHRQEEQYFYIDKIVAALEELGILIERQPITQRKQEVDMSFVDKLA